MLFHYSPIAIALLSLTPILLAAAGDPAPSDPFAHVFAIPNLAVLIKPATIPGTYVGVFWANDVRHSLTARRKGDKLLGSSEVDGKPFDFSATLSGTSLQVVLPKATQTLPIADNSPSPLSAKTLVFKPTVMVDRMWKCDAYTILVPEGWLLEGDILWNPWRTAQEMLFERLSGLDGTRMIHYPVWQYHSEVGAAKGKTDERALTVMPLVASPQEYIERHLFPEQRPDMLKANPKLILTTDLTEAQLKATPPGQGVQLKKVLLRYEYLGVADRPMHEDFTCLLVTSGPPSRAPGQVQVWYCICESYRAPKDQLDRTMPLFNTLNQSRTFDINWFTVITEQQQYWRQNYKNFLQAQLQETMKQIAINQQRTRDITQAQRTRYEADQAARDKSRQAFRQYIADVAPYKSPFGGKIHELPSAYSHAYMNTDGRVILTNDHAYVPPKDANTEWRPMQPAN